jgi:Fe-S cluster biosynthesis and repair protein YggX
MVLVSCARCGETREGAGKVGLPGMLAADIEERTCAVCWQEWLAQQVRVINHYGLRPVMKEDREKLYGFTREFLNLAS